MLCSGQSKVPSWVPEKFSDFCRSRRYKNGFDCQLVGAVTKSVDIPVVASGGFGKLEHLKELMQVSKPTGVAIADSLHYKKFNFNEIRAFCISNNIATRQRSADEKINQ